MIISHKYKFIFFCNGRTGSVSIEAALNSVREDEQYPFGVNKIFSARHIPPAILKSYLPPKIWKEYFKFAFVRNPWDWFVSQYKYNFKKESQLKMLLRTWRYGRRDPLRYISGINFTNKMAEKISYTHLDVDFLFSYLKKYRAFPDSKSLFQSDYVFDVEGNQIIDYVGRFERLSDDFDYISRQIGIKVSLPYLNKSKHLHYREHFSEQASKRVGELWKQDIDNFDYQF